MIALITTIADHGAGAALAFSAGALLLSAVGIIAMLVEDKLSQRRQKGSRAKDPQRNTCARSMGGGEG
jgi:hypothetical protein